MKQKYNLIVWDNENWEDEKMQVDPILETQITLYEDLDKETINVIKSNLRIAFEVMHNISIIVEFNKEFTK